MNLNKDLVIELMQCEIKKLRERIEVLGMQDRPNPNGLFEKELTDKTLDGSMLPPKFGQKGVSHE